MNNLHFIKKTISFLLLSITLHACQQVQYRGQYVSDEMIREVSSKRLSSQSVLDLIGSPTYVPSYNQNTWYYIQRAQSQRAWFRPSLEEQRIAVIEFDKSDRANKAYIIDKLPEDISKFDSNYTPTPGTEANGIQTFVKNIGRFSKTKTKRKKQKD